MPGMDEREIAAGVERGCRENRAGEVTTALKNHLTQLHASDFLAERSPLCMPYSLCKEPERQILHGLVYKNKTSQFCGGRDLKKKEGTE